MIRNDKIIGNSLIQSSYNYFCKCLEDFQKLQPFFKYTVCYGTNSNTDYSEETDTFNFVVYNNSPTLIPSHWQEINGETEILYAGYLDLAVSVLNPMPLAYGDGLSVATTDQQQYTNTTFDQEQFNELPDEDSKKIEFGIRLLEAFALFMRRKGVEIDNFKFTSKCEIPTPDGLFDDGFYRLVTALDIELKFAMQNVLGKSLYNGEDLKVWVKHKDEADDKYREIYNILEFEPQCSMISKTYPLSAKETTTETINQLGRAVPLSCPDLDLGGNAYLAELVRTGDINTLNNLKFRYSNGKKTYEFEAVPKTTSTPFVVDKFNGISYLLTIKTNITEVE